MKHLTPKLAATLTFRLLMMLFLTLIIQRGMGQSWNLSGNSNANDSSKLGTTNGAAFRFYTNNVQRMSIDNSGRVAVGAYDATHASVLFELNSTTRGFLMPRMTQSQRIAIINPVNGLLIFQTDHTKGLYYYLNGVWFSASSPGAYQNLSNLIAPTSINASLIPNSTSLSLGSYDVGWGSIFLNGPGIIYKDGIKFMWTHQASTFLGYDTAPNITTGDDEVGVGYRALFASTTGSKNVAIGVQTLRDNSTGSDNVAIGASAMSGNIFANRNIAIGTEALSTNRGQNNTAVGYQSMKINTSGFRNAAVGYLALSGNTEGADNCAFGSNAMLNNRLGFNNTAIGSSSLAQNIAGVENTAVGTGALSGNPYGAYNTAIGAFSGGFGTAFTFTNCTLVGDGAGIGASNIDNSTALGAHSGVTASNQVRIGNPYVTSIGGFADWTNFSDGRYKNNLKETVPGLEFINLLRPVNFTLDVDAIQKTLNIPANTVSGADDENQIQRKADNQITLQNAANLKATIVYTGFVAQEVETAAKKVNFDFSGVDKPKNENDFYGLRYSEFVVPLVKAVQELDLENKKLREEVQQLKQMVLDIKNGIASNNQINTSSKYLEQNVPNPFGSSTIIRYYIPENYISAAIVIINNAGQIVKSFSIKQKGNGQLTLEGMNLASGFYNYTLYLDGKPSATKQLVVAK